VAQLGDKPYLTGEDFTVADAYLFTVANWTKYTGIDLARWPVLQAYMARVAARHDVQAALKEEGLLK
jgi:glutathione S-transferase